jgi:hypothetical protein
LSTGALRLRRADSIPPPRDGLRIVALERPSDAPRGWTANIIEHLLLLEHSPAREPRGGWIGEILTLRRDIDRRLSGTLRREPQAPTLGPLRRGAHRPAQEARASW